VNYRNSTDVINGFGLLFTTGSFMWERRCLLVSIGIHSWRGFNRLRRHGCALCSCITRSIFHRWSTHHLFHLAGNVCLASCPINRIQIVFFVIVVAQIRDGDLTFMPEVVKVVGVSLPVVLLGNLATGVISEAEVGDNPPHIIPIHGIRKVRNLCVLCVWTGVSSQAVRHLLACPILRILPCTQNSMWSLIVCMVAPTEMGGNKALLGYPLQFNTY
jgi:hypothetical protein